MMFHVMAVRTMVLDASSRFGSCGVAWQTCNGMAVAEEYERECYPVNWAIAARDRNRAVHALMGNMKQWASAMVVDAPPAKKNCTRADGTVSEELIKTLCKLSLGTAQRVRALEAAVYRTWLIPVGSRIAVTTQAAGKAYAEAAKSQGRGHAMGPPHVHVWAAMVLDILADDKQSEDVRTVLRAHAEGASSPTALQPLIRHFRVSKTYDKDKLRVQLCAVHELHQVVEAIHRAILQAGGEEKQGQAPASTLEREVQKYVDGTGGQTVRDQHG